MPFKDVVAVRLDQHLDTCVRCICQEFTHSGLSGWMQMYLWVFNEEQVVRLGGQGGNYDRQHLRDTESGVSWAMEIRVAGRTHSKGNGIGAGHRQNVHFEAGKELAHPCFHLPQECWWSLFGDEGDGDSVICIGVEHARRVFASLAHDRQLWTAQSVDVPRPQALCSEPSQTAQSMDQRITLGRTGDGFGKQVVHTAVTHLDATERCGTRTRAPPERPSTSRSVRR